MSVRRISLGLSALALTAASQNYASAAVVFATDFNAVAPATYPNNTVLNSGGATTDDVTLTSGTGSATTVAERVPGSGDMALQFIDNSTNSNLPRALNSSFGTLSTSGTGENRLTGSFTYTRLIPTAGATTSNSPVFQFVANGNGNAAAFSGDTVIQVQVESSGAITYINGGTGVTSTTLVTPNVEYRFDIDANFSSPTQDTYSLTVTRLSDNVVVVSNPSILTRNANLAVNVLSFNAGANGAALNPAFYAQLDNINFSSSSTVPEPASMGLMFAGGLLALRRRSSARRSA